MAEFKKKKKQIKENITTVLVFVTVIFPQFFCFSRKGIYGSSKNNRLLVSPI